MKIGKIEITKKKIIICGVVALTAIISAGVIFACNKKNTPEVAIEENPVVQTQDANTEEQPEQTPTEVTTSEQNETKNEESKSKEKKESVKENKSKKDNNNQPNTPEVKTDIKVEGDQVVLNADGKDGSSKTILTFNGDKLSKMVLEMSSSDEKMLKDIKEAYEKMGSKILEFNGKNLKAEMSSDFVDEMNKLGKKQDIIDFYKQFSEALKG